MRTRLVNLRIPTHCAPAGHRTGAETVTADILIEGERIAAVTSPSARPAESGEKRVDLADQLVLPGVIDGHVHFDEPGFTHRETFETGTRAAAAGGVTCVVDMPCTSLPPVTSLANLRAKLEVIEPGARVDFVLWGGVSANSLEEPGWIHDLEDIVAEGVGAIKVYLLSGMDTFRDLDPAALESVLRETKRLGIPVGVHAEDREIVQGLTRRLVAEGRTGPLDYAASRPSAGEATAVRRLRELCRRTDARVHVVHVGCAEALEIIAQARREGLPLSGETCPHFLEFTEEDLERQGALLKTAPVVKTEADRERLWQGVIDGDIQHVATDHAPGAWPEEKHTGSIWTDYGGVPGVEHLLPYLYSEGYRSRRIPLTRVVELLCEAPAGFFGIGGRKGRLAAGFDADLAVIDEEAEWTVEASGMHNLNRYTPLEGKRLAGRVTSTFVRGERVFLREADGRETFGDVGFGRRVRRTEWLPG